MVGSLCHDWFHSKRKGACVFFMRSENEYFSERKSSRIRAGVAATLRLTTYSSSLPSCGSEVESAFSAGKLLSDITRIGD
jgi:hypothetical protein